MLRHIFLSSFIFIGTVTTGAIGKQNLANEPSARTRDIVEVELTTFDKVKYTHEQRLVKGPPPLNTTDKEPKRNKRNDTSNESETCPQYEELFKQYGLKPIKTFSYIVWRESRCRPKAVNAKWDSKGNVTWTLNNNGSIDRGLLQINSTWKTVTSNVCGSPYGDMEVLYDLDCNLKVAKYLLDNGGLAHWGM